jgi:hypothetical protein
MKALLATLAALLVGCAGPAKYDKANTTEADFETDKGQCSAQAYSVSNPYPGQIMEVFDSCMRGKGWRRMT